MAEQISTSTIQPNIKEGDSWFMICAEKEQLPRRKSATKDEDVLPIEVIEANAKQRSQAIAQGILPETMLQSIDGHTLWRKYRFTVASSGKDKNPGLTVSVAFVGYHEIPANIIEKYNLPVYAEPQLILKYEFNQQGTLLEAILAETSETIVINGHAKLLDWDVTDFPAGFPLSSPSPENTDHGNAQVVRVEQGLLKVWLGNAIDEINPPQSDPGIEFEVQEWRKDAKWWDEAYVVRDGDVTLVAKTIQ